MIHGTQGKELSVTLGTISKVIVLGNTPKKSRSLTSSLTDMTLSFDSSFPSSSLLFLSIPFLFFVGFFLAVAFLVARLLFLKDCPKSHFMLLLKELLTHF